MLKEVVFANYIIDLDPFYIKIAEKEINTINKSIVKSLGQGFIETGKGLDSLEIGPRKLCKDIIKENEKDYKGLIKAS